MLGHTHGIEEDLAQGGNRSTPLCSASRSAGSIENVQASWVKMGLDAATEALRWGVNDLGGTLMEESMSRMAGSYHGVKLDPDDPGRRGARRQGRPAAQRDTLGRVSRPLETRRGPGLDLGRRSS